MAFLFVAVQSTAHAQDKPTGQVQAEIAVNMFSKFCFMTLADSEKIKAELPDQFIPFEDERKKSVFLDLFNAHEASVWAFRAKDGVYILVSEPSGKCHVAVRKAEADAVHDKMKEFAKKANQNLPHHDVQYKMDKADGFKKSHMQVFAKADDTKTMHAVATTMQNYTPDKPAALLSLIMQ